MAATMKCPGCQTSLRLRDDLAGKKIKCPHCGQILTVPAEEAPLVEEVLEEAPAEKVTTAPRAGKGRSAATRPCPECGEPVSLTARRCRHCRAELDDEEDEEERPSRRRSSYKPCPRCGEGGATRVTWTPWGSFYGPALFTHVRCPACNYAYNGRSGRSNLLPAIFFVLVPLVGILGILGILGWVVYTMSVAKGG